MNGILVSTQSETINLNIDSKTLEMCLKGVSNFGSTTYMNICNGQSAIIPMGGMDWVLTILLVVGALAILGLLIKTILM